MPLGVLLSAAPLLGVPVLLLASAIAVAAAADPVWPAPAAGVQRRAAAMLTAQDAWRDGPTDTGAWLVSGLPTVDAMAPGPRAALPLPERDLAFYLDELGDAVLGLPARYPCPPPARSAWLPGAALAGAGLLAIGTGELIENRMMATEGEDRARALRGAAVGFSLSGLALTMGGGGLAGAGAVQACKDGGWL